MNGTEYIARILRQEGVEWIAITTVVLNNGGMATYPGGFPVARERYGVSHMQGDYAKIAEGMGAVGIGVTRTVEMVLALEEAERLNADGKTVLIDVHSSMEGRRPRFGPWKGLAQLVD